MSLAFLKKAKIISSTLLLLTLFGNFNSYGMEKDMPNSSLEQERRSSLFKWNPLGMLSKSSTPLAKKQKIKPSLRRSISAPDGWVKTLKHMPSSESLTYVDFSREVNERELYAKEPLSRKPAKDYTSYLQAPPAASASQNPSS